MTLTKPPITQAPQTPDLPPDVLEKIEDAAKGFVDALKKEYTIGGLLDALMCIEAERHMQALVADVLAAEREKMAQLVEREMGREIRIKYLSDLMGD